MTGLYLADRMCAVCPGATWVEGSRARVGLASRKALRGSVVHVSSGRGAAIAKTEDNLGLIEPQTCRIAPFVLLRVSRDEFANCSPLLSTLKRRLTQRLEDVSQS